MCCGARVSTGAELLWESWEVEGMKEVVSLVELGGIRVLLLAGDQSSHFLTCPHSSGMLQFEKHWLVLE